jgi:RNA recognition motif-containing protein
MTAKIFVGNLSWNATEDELKQIFSEFGEVISVRIVSDPYTGRSKGFGFIEMADDAACDQAIEKLDNFEFMGRPIRASRARAEQAGGSRPPRAGGDRRFGGPREGGSREGGRGSYAGNRGGNRGGHSQYDNDDN